MRVPFINSGSPVTWGDQGITHAVGVLAPLGRVRIVMNLVVRSTRVIAAVSPVSTQ